jgi:hypothetical protein
MDQMHLGIDAGTLEIRTIEITDSRIGGGPMLPEMLDQIPISKVSADGTYDT